MKPIDADVLLENLEDYRRKSQLDADMCGNRDSAVTWGDAIGFIKSAPEIDYIIDISEFEKEIDTYLAVHPGLLAPHPFADGLQVAKIIARQIFLRNKLLYIKDEMEK